MSDLPSFGTILRELRERTPNHRTGHAASPNLSQDGLAEMIGVHWSYICRLESNGRNPSRATVGRIVAALDLGTIDSRALYAAAGYVTPDDAHRAVLTWRAAVEARKALAQMAEEVA